MKHFSMVVLAIACSSPIALVQTATSLHGRSPKEIIEQYTEMGNQGMLLTAEGWNEASQLFVHQEAAPKDGVIVVIDHGSSLHETSIDENRVDLDEPYEDLGRIDSKLRYTPAPPSSFAATSLLYHLVRTEKHWELGPDGKAHEVTGKPEWRIENPRSRWTSVDGAIHYVISIRDQTKDPEVKQNADATLAKLRKLH